MEFLDSLLVTPGPQNGRVLKHTYRMNKWVSTHQLWELMGNKRAVIHKSGKRYIGEEMTN